MRKVIEIFKRCIYEYARMISCCFLLISATFLTISLWTFNVTDLSPLYFSTDVTTVHNKGGMFGAYIAGIFYYLFGSMSLFFAPFLFFIAYLLMMRKPFAQQWERLVAGITAISFSAALCHMCRFDLVGVYPGGYVGTHLVRIVLHRLDTLSAYLFICVMLFISVVLLFRFSFIGPVHYLVKSVRFLMSQRFLQPVYNTVSYVVWAISRPVVWLYAMAHKLYKAETIHNEDRSILEFERGIKQANLKDDTFWQDYLNQKDMPSSEILTDENDTIVEPEPYVQEQSFSDNRFNRSETCDTFKESTYQEEQIVDEGPDDVTDSEQYALPSLNIFIGNHEERDDPKIMQYLQERAQTLQDKLQRFGVSGSVASIKRGPVVTLFEYQPEIDCKISKITSLEDDLALALQALSIRIIAPIPGKSLVGFEVSNKHRKNVYFAEVVQSEAFKTFDGSLPLVLGQDTVGNNIIVDLVRMPHLLIAGSTGSGKSVALNAMLISMLCKLSPDQLRLVLIDPKRLEFASYGDIAHLLFPIVTHPKKAAPVLTWVVKEMEDRYEKMAKEGGRNIHDYNILMEQSGRKALPYIVVVIDELADLMMTAGREIEDLIARITQMARAAGIHLMVATQRPSVDVITGLIKVNFPSRVSFRVTSKIDSRTILDCAGADKLLGRGDMLFLDAHGAGLQRLHGAYVSDTEIDQVVDHIRSQRQVEYLDLNEHIEQCELEEDRDDIYTDVLLYLQDIDEVSISLLQRKFKIGYNRSARIIDMLEAEGFIAPAGGGKTRSVIR